MTCSAAPAPGRILRSWARCYPPSLDFRARACARAGPLRCDDAERDARVNREVCRELGIASVVVMPVVNDDEVLGVFELFSGKANAFGDRDLSALQRLSDMVETAVRLARAAENLPDPLQAVSTAEVQTKVIAVVADDTLDDQILDDEILEVESAQVARTEVDEHVVDVQCEFGLEAAALPDSAGVALPGVARRWRPLRHNQK